MARTVILSALLTAFLSLPCARPARAQTPHPPADPSFMLYRGRIGVHVQPMTPELRDHFKAPPDRGLLVSRVEPDRPAARAGVEVGDVIVLAGGEPMREPSDLVRAVARVDAGGTIDLKIVRNEKTVTLTLEPEGEAMPWADPDRWKGWAEEGLRHGSEELRRQLRELERRLEELERKFEERRKNEESAEPAGA